MLSGVTMVMCKMDQVHRLLVLLCLINTITAHDLDEILFTGSARPYSITINPVEYDPPAGTNGSELDTVTVAAASVNESSCILQARPAKRLVNLSKIPILVVTSQASYHAVYDRCTVEYLRQAGVNVTWLSLPLAGVFGNGHFIFMEKNNIEIAERVGVWLDELEL